MTSILLSLVLAQSLPPARAADAAAIKREIEVICQAFVDKDRKVLEETHGKDWRVEIRPAADAANSPRWHDDGTTLLRDGAGIR